MQGLNGGEELVVEEKRPILPLIIAAVLLVALVALIFFLREEALQLSAGGFSANLLGFLFLINGNIIAIMVLGFLVVKNVVKLLLDRNRGLLGSRLRTRLVVAFVGLALVPTILLFLISRGIINSVLQYWFSPQVTASVDGALAVARYQYDALEKSAAEKSDIFAERLSELLPLLVDARGVVGGESELQVRMEEGQKLLSKFLKEKCRELNLVEATVLRLDGTEVNSFRDPAISGFGSYLNPQLNNLKSAIDGVPITKPERSRYGELIRSYTPIKINNTVRHVLLTSSVVSEEMSELLSQVLDAYEDYRELRTYRIPLTSTYLLALVVVSLLILLGAIWVGFYLARTISGPIQALAEGTVEVAKGNLRHRIPDVGHDELSTLVHSFNRMTEDLEVKTGELVERRHYMETVLESIGSGVFSLDHKGIITTCNRAAQNILALSGSPVGSTIESLGSLELAEAIKDIESKEGVDELSQKSIPLVREGRTKYLQVTKSQLGRSGEVGQGVVVLLEDLTELIRAQKTLAWQEVARRMAHEIKNPLTPIQLSAQRIERRLIAGDTLSPDNKELVQESCSTISRSVETLRSLVAEFSRFSRLPKARLQPLAFKTIVDRVSGTFRESHPTVRFSVTIEGDIPEIMGDPDQLDAVLTNLYENAVQAIGRTEPPNDSAVVETDVSVQGHSLVVKVSDNGAGVSDEDKPKLFEPYFSTRKGGTGLGLAIVNSIISDHGGKIQVGNNHMRGTVVHIELPLLSANSSSRSEPHTVSALSPLKGANFG